MLPFHPQTVHFPIAFLILAGGLYVISHFQEDNFWSRAGFYLHIAGVLGLVVAIFSGQQAESAVVQTSEIHDLITNHERLAYLVTWLFGMLLIWKYLRRNNKGPIEHWAFVILFIGSIFIMAYGSHLGGTLVYEKGAGVEPMYQIQQDILKSEQESMD